MSTNAKPVNTRNFPYRTLITIAIILIYVIAIVIGAIYVYEYARDQVANSDILPELTIDSGTVPKNPNVEQEQGNPLPIWTGTDRITVLILGIDERAQTEDFWRTDTMMLVTLDPVTMQAGVLSIPRDLWVHIPGYSENRINTAHFLGDAYDHPGGGPALAVETVEYNLGVEIDYYVRINFQAFVELVDRIGGIEIDVPETIDDPDYPDGNYGYELFHVDAGINQFYGEDALKYARTRHSTGGDFDRARRQQQVVKAVFKKVTSLNMLPQLALQAPELLETLQSSVKLDPQLQLDEIIALANLASQVDSEDITFRVIDETCTLFKVTPEEYQILVPLRERIREVRDEVFQIHTTNGDTVHETPESATIAVFNGTTTAGLAFETTEYLKTNGIIVAEYSNADRSDYDKTVVIMNRKMPNTAAEIIELLGVPQSALVNGQNPTAQYDIVIILGADYVEKTVTGLGN